jgi:hypothetical protein
MQLLFTITLGLVLGAALGGFVAFLSGVWIGLEGSIFLDWLRVR